MFAALPCSPSLLPPTNPTGVPAHIGPFLLALRCFGKLVSPLAKIAWWRQSPWVRQPTLGQENSLKKGTCSCTSCFLKFIESGIPHAAKRGRLCAHEHCTWDLGVNQPNSAQAPLDVQSGRVPRGGTNQYFARQRQGKVFAIQLLKGFLHTWSGLKVRSFLEPQHHIPKRRKVSSAGQSNKRPNLAGFSLPLRCFHSLDERHTF